MKAIAHLAEDSHQWFILESKDFTEENPLIRAILWGCPCGATVKAGYKIELPLKNPNEPA